MKYTYLFILFFLLSAKIQAQNLPSLLLEKNINATFSILAYDENTKEWGIAVATNNIYVGNSTIYIEPGKGAFSVIAETEPLYASRGFNYLKEGKSIREAIETTRQQDEESHYRQISGIDSAGNVYAFTGEALKYWKGTSSHLPGEKFVVMGNQLADGVLQHMYDTFVKCEGTLAERLLSSLVSGQSAGGQVQGKQSAALVVKGSQNEWFNDIDLRVDNSEEPFQDLQKLLNYHYGRIRLNQSVYALRNNKTERGRNLLQQAETLLEGWNGIYSKIAMAYLLLGEEDKAIKYIKKGLEENPLWKEHLSAFYLIKDHPQAKGLILENDFTEKDWASALSMMLNVGQTENALSLSERLLKQYPTSQMNYLNAKTHARLGKFDIAKQRLQTALKTDHENIEAKNLLAQLNTHD